MASVLVIFGVCQRLVNQRRNLPRQKRRYRISDLHILLSSISEKKVVVRKSLQSCSLAYRQTATLQGVGMYEVVAVFRYMAGYGRRRLILELYPEAVSKYPAMPVPMIGGEFDWKIG